MAKLVLSDEISKIENIKKSSIKSGFTKYNEIHNSEFYLIAFKKLAVDNENLVKIQNNDFVATAGTLIYKEKIGKNALRNIYYDFEGNINNIRKNVIGNYFITIKKGDNICIFCDENNIFNVYYLNNKTNWIVSNSLFDIAKYETEKLTINEFNFIEYTFQFSIIGNGTIFNEINKLRGDEYILINLKNSSFNIITELPGKITINFDNEEDLTKQFTNALNNKIKVISRVFDKITISMTGGLDTRTIFSSFLRNNVKPNLVYGVGNSPLTNTKNRDLEIDKMFAERYGLNFHIMNWETPEKVDKYWNKYMNKYGLLSLIYYSSNNIFNELENLNTEFIEFGYFGEPLRNVPWLENLKNEKFDIYEFIDDFYINSNIKKVYINYEEYRQNLIEKFINICKNNNIDYMNIDKDNFQILHNEYRKRADTKLVNFSNSSFYSISILSQKDLLDFSLNIPYSFKKNAKFMLKSLFEIYPDILKVPFFSHTEDWIFDEKEFKLIKKYEGNNIIRNFKQKLKNNIKNEYLLKILKSIDFQITKRKYTKKELDEIKKNRNLTEYFIKKINKNNYNFLENLNKYEGSIHPLAYYAQLLTIINNIMKQ